MLILSGIKCSTQVILRNTCASEEPEKNTESKYKIVHTEKTECYRLNFNNGFPTSFIIDKKGKIVYSKLGGQIDKAKASQEILSEVYPKILEHLSR